MKVNTTVSTIIKDYKCSENAFLPKTVLIPLCQEHGTICKALVDSGDTVKEGQLIAEFNEKSKGKSYIHSSIPGKVMNINPCQCPDGKQEFGIEIQLEGSFSYLGKKLDEENIDSLSMTKIQNSILNNGIINTFNTSKPISLSKEVNKKGEIKNIVVRLFDEDPTRITDSLVSKFFMDQVLTGAKLLRKACNAEHIILVIDQKINMQTEDGDIYILPVNLTSYPAGYIREITEEFNRQYKRFSGFGLTNKDLFIDSSTAYDIYNCVTKNIPSISKLVHFSGNCLKASCLLNVRIGTNVKDIVSQIGGFIKEPHFIIVNGKMAGVSVQSLDIPVTKSLKSIEFVSRKKIEDSHIYSCVNCGNCRLVCPVHISPDILYNYASNFKKIEDFMKKSAQSCTNCGLCNTVCLSRLPLSQTVNFIKDSLDK